MTRAGVVRFASVLVMLGGLVAPFVPAFHAVAQPAGAGFIGTDQLSYGSNQIVTASGVIDYVTNCPAQFKGVNDFLDTAADVYLIRGNPTIGDGSSIKGLSFNGAPTDTIQSDTSGGFFGESIGTTQPQGTLPGGTWSIVLDECQDGIFHAGIDEVQYDAFTVTLQTNVPPNPALTALKSDANAEFQHWQSALNYVTTVQDLQKIKSALKKIQKFQAIMDAFIGGGVAAGVESLSAYAISQLIDQANNAFTGPYNAAKAEAIAGGRNALANTAKHWQELANDPPDPNYKQVTIPPAFPVLAPDSADAPTQASAALGTAAGTEAALTQAFVDAVQRYEGAQQTHDGSWALIHAREAQAYATLLANQIAITDGTFGGWSSAYGSDATALDNLASNMETMRSTLAAGIPADVQQQLLADGFTPTQISALQSTAQTSSFAVTVSQATSALQAVSSGHGSLVSDLTAYATSMGSIVQQLESDPTVTDTAPVASAGGPYSATQGQAITLDGSGSTIGPSGSPIVSYAWDLDGSGTFATTSTNPTMSVTFDEPFSGLVGLTVTNAAGISSVAYAQVTVSGTNQPPQITAFSPNADTPTIVPVDQAQVFSVTTQDAENDPTQVQWFLDGKLAGQGSSFNYTPGPIDIGTHPLQAQATDANLPGNGLAIQTWLISVCPAPAVPGQPTNVGATAGDAQATITWTAPAESCGNAVTGYVVIASTGQSATLPAAATGVNFLGLTNGIPVSFTVTALNALGDGQPSSPSPTVTPTGTVTPPPVLQGSLTLTPIASGFPNPISVDWYQPTNQMLMSVNYSNGNPNNFDLVDANGNFAAFSGVSYLTDEVYVAAIRASSCEGGFTPGDVYFGTGTPGEVGKLYDNGKKFIKNWVDLPGETSSLSMVRGGLFQDVNCVAGGDLIVTLENGDVWRVTAAGIPRKLAGGFGALYLEGPSTVPDDPTRYGPWAGKIIAPDEYAGSIWSIDPNTGEAKQWSGGTYVWPTGEGVAVIPPNENFFGVDWGAHTLVGLPASDFTSMVGDILLWTEDYGRLIDIKWDPTSQSFVSLNLLKTPAVQWEGATFAGAGLPGVSGTTGLSCIATTSTAQLGSLVKLTGQLVNVANPGGIPVSFVDTGANPQTATVATDANGIATFNLAGSTVGSETVVLTTDVGGQVLTSNPCDVTWQGTSPGELTYTGPASGDYGDSVTLTAHLVDGSNNPLSGDGVEFTLGTQSCSGSTDTSGDASCTINIDQPPGPVTVTATYTAQSGWYATDSAGFTITPEEAVLTYTGPTALDYHDPATVSATLTSDDKVPLDNQTVSFTLNSNESCGGTTASGGAVNCSLTPSEAAGGYPLALAYAGNSIYQPATVSPTISVQLEQTSLAIVSANALTVDHAIVLAKLLEDGDASMPLVGKAVEFTATPTGGGSTVTGSGTVLADGVAAAQLTLGSGTYDLAASFGSDGYYAAASDTQSLTVTGQHQTRLTYTGATSGDFNDHVTLSATLTDVTSNPSTPVAGKTLDFILGSGGGAVTCSGMTDQNGIASCTVTPTVDPASLGVTVSFAGDSAYLSSSTTAGLQLTQEDTKLIAAGSFTQDYHDPLTVSATLLDPTDNTLITGKVVSFSVTGTGAVSGEGCSGATDGNGVASCSFTPAETAGSYTLDVSFAGDSDYMASTTSAPLIVTLEQPTLTMASPTTSPVGNVTITAQLLEDDSGAVPIGGRSVAITATPMDGGPAVTGTGTTDAGGNVAVQLNLSSGDYELAAHFDGDAYYLAANAQGQVNLYVYQPTQFVIWGGNPPGTASNPNVSVGSDYTFWGSQWSKQINGGSAQGVASFKGYVDTVAADGTSWTANPGNSSQPPSQVSTYIAVMVTTQIAKQKNTITGNVAEEVILKVDDPNGYQANPGHSGTGVLVAVIASP